MNSQVAFLVAVLAILGLILGLFVAFFTTVFEKSPSSIKYAKKKLKYLVIVFISILMLFGVVTYFKEINKSNTQSDVPKDDIELLEVDIPEPTILDIKLRNISNNDLLIKKFYVHFESLTPQLLPLLSPSATFSANIKPNDTESLPEDMNNRPLNLVIKAHSVDRFNIRLNTKEWGGGSG